MYIEKVIVGYSVKKMLIFRITKLMESFTLKKIQQIILHSIWDSLMAIKKGSQPIPVCMVVWIVVCMLQRIKESSQFSTIKYTCIASAKHMVIIDIESKQIETHLGVFTQSGPFPCMVCVNGIIHLLGGYTNCKHLICNDITYSISIISLIESI